MGDLVEIDSQPLDLVQVPTGNSPEAVGLLDLPNELLSLIATFLMGTDLFSLREVKNRSIRYGIDHVWSERYFKCRRFQTTSESISRLGTIARSRFAKHIRCIFLEMRFACREQRALDCETKARLPATAPRVSKSVFLESLATELAATFQNARNLETVGIYAPLKVPRARTLNMVFLNQGAWFRPPINAIHTAHNHSNYFVAPNEVLQTIMTAVTKSQPNLDSFVVFNIHKTLWQPHLALTSLLLKSLQELPSALNLTTLELELDMFTESADDAVSTIVSLISNNAKLRRLKICAGPDLDTWFRRPSDCWAPLLELLGTDPPFRLRSLEIDGLVTSGRKTMDQIIGVHSSTLRRIVLDHTSFRLPNSMRAFFAAMAKLELHYFAVKNFWLHDTSWISGSTSTCTTRLDECLHWFTADDLSKDQTYKDWIHIDWEESGHAEWIIYDNQNGSLGQTWMSNCMLSVVEMIDCGGIEE